MHVTMTCRAWETASVSKPQLELLMYIVRSFSHLSLNSHLRGKTQYVLLVMDISTSASTNPSVMEQLHLAEESIQLYSGAVCQDSILGAKHTYMYPT